VTATVTRRRAARGQGEQLRAQILEAAGELLTETGREEDVSIRAVAERVGVTPPSIYLHFADKDALLDAVCVESFADFHEALQMAAAEHPDDVQSAIAAQGRAYIHFALARPEHYRLMFMRRPDRDLAMPTEAELSAVAGLGSVIDTVRLAQERGVIAPGDPARVAFTLWAAAHGIAALLIAKPHFPWGDTDELIDRVTQMCLHGLVQP
jgi:AcrR family transcriptional regulator